MKTCLQIIDGYMYDNNIAKCIEYVYEEVWHYQILIPAVEGKCDRVLNYIYHVCHETIDYFDLVNVIEYIGKKKKMKNVKTLINNGIMIPKELLSNYYDKTIEKLMKKTNNFVTYVEKKYNITLTKEVLVNYDKIITLLYLAKNGKFVIHDITINEILAKLLHYGNRYNNFDY